MPSDGEYTLIVEPSTSTGDALALVIIWFH